MTLEILEQALRHPKPFTLYLTDGRKLDVPHPEFVWLVPPNKNSLFVSRPGQGGYEFLRVNQIVSLYRPDGQSA